MMKSVFPDQYNQSLYTPTREDRQIASLQSNRSPNVSVVNLTQGMDVELRFNNREDLQDQVSFHYRILQIYLLYH